MTAGVKADTCALGFSCVQFDLGIPPATLSPGCVVRLVLAPCLLWGNDMVSLEELISSSDVSDSIDLAAGRLLVLDVSMTDSFKSTRYDSYDENFRFAGGGNLSCRLLIGGSLVRDPNAVESPRGCGC